MQTVRESGEGEPGRDGAPGGDRPAEHPDRGPARETPVEKPQRPAGARPEGAASAGAGEAEESLKQRWRTPAPILAWVRAVQGGIDLDPATEADNPTGASCWLTREYNALERPWPNGQRLFLNPPFRKLEPFARLAKRWLGAGRVGVFIGSYSLEAGWARELGEATGTVWLRRPRVLSPSPRIMFDLPPDAPADTPRPGGYPATVWVWSSRTTGNLADLWEEHVGGRVTIYRPEWP